MHRYIILFVSIVFLINACSEQDDSQQENAKGIALNTASTAIVTSRAIDNSTRLALVIGNKNYQNVPSLRNPINDANDMAAILKNLGFKVILKLNADKKTMVSAVQDFGKRLRHGNVGLFYFSGHGLQSNKRNYLMPVDANIKSEADIEFEGFDANRVLAQMGQANKINIVILDACRDNPYKTSTLKGLKKGLARMDSPSGTLIAFATAPNTPAWDGKLGERNGVYTKHLLAALQNKAHWSVTDLFIDVRDKVMQETQNEAVQQVPWESVSLRKIFCFGKCGETDTTIIANPTSVNTSESPQIDSPTSDKTSIFFQVDAPTNVNKVKSELVNYIFTSSSTVSRGDVLKVKINTHSSRIRAFGIFKVKPNQTIRVVAKYSPEEGGIYISYRVPEDAAFGLQEARIFVQEIGSAKEEQHVVKYKVFD